MKNWQKKLLLSTTFVAVALSSTVQAKEWKTIRFGTESAYAPFEYKTPDNKLVGFDIDLGNAICAKLKAKCVWVENSFDGMIPALKAKKFDGILSSMTVTTDRAKQIAFSNKIYNTPTRMVAKKGSPLLPTPASLKGKRVGVQQGTIQEGYAKAYWAPKGVNVSSLSKPRRALPRHGFGTSRCNITRCDYGRCRFPKIGERQRLCFCRQ